MKDPQGRGGTEATGEGFTGIYKWGKVDRYREVLWK